MTTQLPHDWREILKQAEALDMTVLAVAGSLSEQIREAQATVRELRAEAKAIHDEAEKAGKEPEEADAKRFAAIMDDDGELDAAERRIVSLKNRKAGLDKLAIEQHDAGPTNPLDGARPNRGPEADSSAPALAFRDAQTGRMVTPLGINDRFSATPEHDPFGDDVRLSLGERVVAHLTGNRPSGVHAETALFEGTDGQGGFLLPHGVMGPMIDLARPATVAFRAGASILPMSTSEVTLVQQLSDPEAHWTPELGKVPSSAMSFGRIVLRPKKLAALIPLSMELLEDAANAGTLVERAIQDRMALALDQAILSGKGTASEPLGIRNSAGVNVVTASDPIADYLDLEEAISRIETANYSGDLSSLAWIANPRDASQFRRLQANDLQPLAPTPGAAALQRYQTTSLPVNLGDGDDEGEMIVGDMSQVVVGMRTSATLRFLPAGTATDGDGNSINAVEQFATILAVHMRADVAVIRPEWLSVIQGVGWPS